jgi:hypothetical protein
VAFCYTYNVLETLQVMKTVIRNLKFVILKKPKSLENAQMLEAYPRLKRKSFLLFFQKQKDCSGKRVYGWENARAFWFKNL